MLRYGRYCGEPHIATQYQWVDETNVLDTSTAHLRKLQMAKPVTMHKTVQKGRKYREWRPEHAKVVATDLEPVAFSQRELFSLANFIAGTGYIRIDGGFPLPRAWTATPIGLDATGTRWKMLNTAFGAALSLGKFWNWVCKLMQVVSEAKGNEGRIQI